MSYDLRVAVKVEGCDEYANIARPEYDSPTYNLSEMFGACMDWDFEQGVYYKCSEYLPKLERGVMELKFHAKDYKKYEPSNGWGTVESAFEALDSWWRCIKEEAEYIPLECLYMRW